MVLTLWDDNLRVGDMLAGLEGRVVLQAKGVLLRDFNGPCVSTATSSFLSIDPPGAQVRGMWCALVSGPSGRVIMHAGVAQVPCVITCRQGGSTVWLVAVRCMHACMHACINAVYMHALQAILEWYNSQNCQFEPVGRYVVMPLI